MIRRYTRPEMRALFSDTGRFPIWLEVELAHLQTLEDAAIAPSGVTARARAKASFDVERIDALEATLHHDVIAFLTDVGNSLGEDRTYLHFGMTSSLTSLEIVAAVTRLVFSARPLPFFSSTF